MIGDAPQQRYRFLRRFIPKALHPWLRGARRRLFVRRDHLDEPFRSVLPYTQAAPIRQENLLRLATDIEANGIAGAVVECGVLDGGTAAIMAYGTSNRPVHLFDSWEGLPETTSEDGEGGMWVGECYGSQRRVLNIMRELEIDRSRLNLHRGWFSDTFPEAKIERIALLHIDADFYSSVKLCLDTWYSRMAPGGYIQFDDYGIFVGCTKAVDEFLAQRPDIKLQSLGTHTKVYFLRVPKDAVDKSPHINSPRD